MHHSQWMNQLFLDFWDGELVYLPVLVSTLVSRGAASSSITSSAEEELLISWLVQLLKRLARCLVLKGSITSISSLFCSFEELYFSLSVFITTFCFICFSVLRPTVVFNQVFEYCPDIATSSRLARYLVHFPVLFLTGNGAITQSLESKMQCSLRKLKDAPLIL